jgi:hypothetical protein
MLSLLAIVQKGFKDMSASTDALTAAVVSLKASVDAACTSISLMKARLDSAPLPTLLDQDAVTQAVADIQAASALLAAAVG